MFSLCFIASFPEEGILNYYCSIGSGWNERMDGEANLQGYENLLLRYIRAVLPSVTSLRFLDEPRCLAILSFIY